MVDAFLIALAVGVFVALVRRPRPVHPITAILLAMLTGVLLWANLRRNGWPDVWGGGIHGNLNPVQRAMFWRGWPFCPFMFCRTRGMTYHPDGLELCALIFDGVIFVVALLLAKVVSERCLRSRQPFGTPQPDPSLNHDE